MGIQLERPAPLLCAAVALVQVRKVTCMNELGNMIFRRGRKRADRPQHPVVVRTPRIEANAAENNFRASREELTGCDTF